MFWAAETACAKALKKSKSKIYIKFLGKGDWLRCRNWDLSAKVTYVQRDRVGLASMISPALESYLYFALLILLCFRLVRHIDGCQLRNQVTICTALCVCLPGTTT